MIIYKLTRHPNPILGQVENDLIWRLGAMVSPKNISYRLIINNINYDIIIYDVL